MCRQNSAMNDSVTLARISQADTRLQFYELESSIWSQEDIDSEGRFSSLSGFLERLRDPDAVAEGYFVHQGLKIVGFLLVGLQQLDGRAIKELADIYVLPKYRGFGIATEAVRQIVMTSNQPWLVCVFRRDLNAQGFWERALQRLPFCSVRQLLPPEYPDLREFIVNDSPQWPSAEV